jgi:hypothetical protein
MSVHEGLFTVPHQVAMPRGAQWAARFAVWLLHKGHKRGRAMSPGVQRPAPLAPSYKRQTPTLLQAIGHSIWDALAATGQRRAARELRELAQRWESIDPAVARQLREASRHDTRS